MLVVFERKCCCLELAGPFDVHLVVTVYQDVTDRWVLKQLLEWAQTEDFIQQLAG
jgi:hypothetical protein